MFNFSYKRYTPDVNSTALRYYSISLLHQVVGNDCVQKQYNTEGTEDVTLQTNVFLLSWQDNNIDVEIVFFQKWGIYIIDLHPTKLFFWRTNLHNLLFNVSVV